MSRLIPSLCLLLLTAGICPAELPTPGHRLKIKANLAPAQFNEQESLAKLRALELFPDMEPEDSPLHKRVEEEVARMASEEPRAFDRPDWPVTAARYCAGCLGIKARSIADILQKAPEKKVLQWARDPHFDDLVIRHADYTVGSVTLDVTRSMQARVIKGTLTVLCDDSLLPDPAEDDGGATREDGETGAEFWKRQMVAMRVSTIKQPKAPRSLKVVYERRGELHTVTTERGKSLQIDLPDQPPKDAEKAGDLQKETTDEPVPARKPASVFLTPADIGQ